MSESTWWHEFYPRARAGARTRRTVRYVSGGRETACAFDVLAAEAAVLDSAPMRTAIRHTTIVSADAARTIHHDATLIIDDDRIAAIDETNRVADSPGADVIDGRGKAVFPGLSNCHTHLHLTHSRGIQEDFGFPSSLRFPSTVAAFMSQEELGVFAAPSNGCL